MPSTGAPIEYQPSTCRWWPFSCVRCEILVWSNGRCHASWMGSRSPAHHLLQLKPAHFKIADVVRCFSMHVRLPQRFQPTSTCTTVPALMIGMYMRWSLFSSAWKGRYLHNPSCASRTSPSWTTLHPQLSPAWQAPLMLRQTNTIQSKAPPAAVEHYSSLCCTTARQKMCWKPPVVHNTSPPAFPPNPPNVLHPYSPLANSGHYTAEQAGSPELASRNFTTPMFRACNTSQHAISPIHTHSVL